MEMEMGLAQYAIVPIRDQWGVLHDGDIKGEYATKESAFESAVAAAIPGAPARPRGSRERPGPRGRPGRHAFQPLIRSAAAVSEVGVDPWIERDPADHRESRRL